MESTKAGKHSIERHSNEMQRINKCVLSVCKRLGELLMDLSWIWIWIWIEVDMEMTEMAETHVELNQFPVPRVGPRHSTQYMWPSDSPNLI